MSEEIQAIELINQTRDIISWLWQTNLGPVLESKKSNYLYPGVHKQKWVTKFHSIIYQQANHWVCYQDLFQLFLLVILDHVLAV